MSPLTSIEDISCNNNHMKLYLYQPISLFCLCTFFLLSSGLRSVQLRRAPLDLHRYSRSSNMQMNSHSSLAVIVPNTSNAERFISLVRVLYPNAKPVNLDVDPCYQIMSLSADSPAQPSDITQLSEVYTLLL